MKNLFAAAFILVTLAACAGSKDLAPGKTGKSFTVSGQSYDAIWNAALTSVKQNKGDQSLEIEKDLVVSESDKSKGVIRASSGMSLLSWGEVIGIFISPPYNAPTHTIEVESKAKLQTNVFANNWEDEIIASIKRTLATK